MTELDDADPGEFDALMIPGGLMNPDQLRSTPEALEFVRAFFGAGKPVAAICHGPQVLISADVLRGRTLTCWPSIAIDVKNAGGLYADRPLLEDGPLLTARKSDDVPALAAALVRRLAPRGT